MRIEELKFKNPENHTKEIVFYQRQIDNISHCFMGKIEASKNKYPDLLNRRDEISGLWSLIPYINETDEVARITQYLLDNVNVAESLFYCLLHHVQCCDKS